MKQSKQNIYYSPRRIRKILDSSIDIAADNIHCYCNDPVSNFTRNRKLSVRTLIRCIMNFSSHSTVGELSYFFDDNDDMPTSSALCQRRKLLDPVIFKRINDLFVNSFDNLTTINGYHILAQDGSDINIPFMDDETRCINGNNKSFCQYHINALYDCLNNVFYDWSIDPYSKKQEISALISIVKKKNFPQNSILTADRGYENYNLIAHLIKNDIKFAIRVKDINKNGIMRNIKTGDGAFDINVTRIMTRLQTKEIKADKEKYVFVPTTSRFDFLSPLCDFYELSFRVVRFKITEDTYETIITNLSEEEFHLKDFKELYNYRWKEETAFAKLKYTMGMVYFHAKNRRSIQQEINATILMYNISETIVRNIHIKQNRKYHYKANFSSAVTNIRLYLKNMIKEKTLILRIKKILVPQRPERSFERNIKNKSCLPLNHRTS